MEQQTKTFLDEGFDFIEESYSEIPLEFTETSKDIIVEAKGGSPSPYHILGVCRGVFQPVNEPSRNGRIYDSDHWQYQINKPELQERLQNRQMLGQIGHRNERVNDFVLSAGEVSHVVTKMEIREGSDGKPYLYGELEILDTPAGRILKALYEGGVGLYISSRGAGKLETIPGQTMKRVSKTSFFLETWDIVKAPGYLKAKPVYESSPTHESITEENINELNDKTIESDLDKRQDQMYDAEARAKENPKAAAEAKKKFENAVNLAQKRADRNDEILDQDKNGNPVHYKNESEEIAELNNKINQLTKIIEKVVDDVYESDNEPTQSIEEQLGDLLFNPSITEEAFEDVIAILKESKPELVNTIMENSRKKFNDEHAEKSGLEIEYYRFGGKKPYKVVPKGTDYFAASLDSPKYRSLKQAQKHVLDSYNKPKENTSEALSNFVSLMADSNISEEAFEEILDMIKGDLK